MFMTNLLYMQKSVDQSKIWNHQIHYHEAHLQPQTYMTNPFHHFDLSSDETGVHNMYDTKHSTYLTLTTT